jgi:predicted ATPase
VDRHRSLRPPRHRHGARRRHINGDAFIETLRAAHRYNRLVFLTPPWPEIYTGDSERKHGFDVAIEEYERLLRDYDELGYDISVLPKSGIEERADFILTRID